MRILFVTATRIGDAVLSTGLLSHVVNRFPEARLTIAAGPVAAPLAWMLRAGERRVMAKGDQREHRVRQLGRLFGLDPPPGPVLWTAPDHERGAEALLPP